MEAHRRHGESRDEATESVSKSREKGVLGRECGQVALLVRRQADIFGVMNVIGVLLISHCWTVPKAMQVSEDASVLGILGTWIRSIWLILLALFLANWAAVVCYGPGRPKAEHSSLPTPLHSLLAAGHSLQRPLTAEDAWCRVCEAEKPALASHCHQCNRCCYWMDHHCNFFGQCVGFRNMRCFIVALIYGNLMCAYLVAITLLLWTEPTFASFPWFCVAAWTIYILWWWRKVWHFLRCACWEVVTGWRSSVLRMKLSQWQVVASEQGAELRFAQSGDDAMQRAFSEVILLPWEPTHPLGIFLEPGQFGRRSSCWEQFQGVFGSPPSIAWLLPICGGTGDPWQPVGVSTKACEAWLLLASAVEAFKATWCELQPRDSRDSRKTSTFSQQINGFHETYYGYLWVV